MGISWKSKALLSVCFTLCIYIAEVTFKTTNFSEHIPQPHFFKEPSKVNNYSVLKSEIKTSGERNACINEDFLIYRCVNGSACGGWGDRLKGIVSTYLLSKLANRSFGILMEKPCPLQLFLSPNSYDWLKCWEFIKGVKRTNPVHNHVDDPQFRQKLSKMNLSSVFKHRLEYFTTNMFLIDQIKLHKLAKSSIPWIINSTLDTIISNVIQMLFKPSRTLVTAEENLISDTNSRLRSDGKPETIGQNNKLLACGHIRMFHNPSIPTDVVHSKDRANARVMFNFLDRFKDPRKYNTFIATDSEEIKAKARKRYRNHFSEVQGEIVHVDRFKGTSVVNACQGFLKALLEQRILSKCDVLLISRSNFGTMAAYMRTKTENLYCYDPKTNSVLNCSNASIQSLYKFV